MKQYFYLALLLIMVTYQKAYTQKVYPQRVLPFMSHNVFHTNFFIENKGQFNYMSPKGQSIRYAVENGEEKVYFHNNGLVWKVRKYTPVDKESSTNTRLENKKNAEEEENERMKLEESKIQMRWIDANKDCKIEHEGKSSHYFSYGDEAFKSYGYEKITYRNLYRGIDVEYIIPEQGGIKYSLILKPGADIYKVKFAYQGKGVQVLNQTDRLYIKNRVLDLVESKLNVFDETGRKLPCSFKSVQDGISFDLDKSYDPTKKLTIDPWVTPVTTLIGTTGNNIGYDVDYDYAGNLLVYGGGGSGNILVAKYSAAGALLWTFNGTVASIPWNSIGGGSYAGNFIVEKISGKVYLGQGFNSAMGTTMVRLNANGLYDGFISTANINFNEIWEMNFDCNSGNILGMGGGTSGNINMGIIDNLGNYSTSNVTGVGGICQDIVSSTIDPSGNLFILMTTICGDPILFNKIFRVNSTLNGNLWMQPTGFLNMDESDNKSFVGSSFSNGLNVLHANVNYLYYYDGFNVKAFNKTTGLSVGTPTTIAGYTEKMQAGIYVDDCDNLYLGGSNGNIKVMHFNGSTFSSLPEMVLPGLTGKKVHDIKYNYGNGMMYITGDEFVATAFRSNLCPDTASLNLQVNVDCDSVIATIINADSSSTYSFIWTDSTTNLIVQAINNGTQTADTLHTLIPGHTYHIQVLKNALCGGASQLLSFIASNSTNVTLNPVICTGQSFTVNGHVYTTTGVYSDTLFSLSGCDSVITTNLNVVAAITYNQSFNICNGQSVTVNGNVYNTTGVYYDSVVTSGGCDSVTITNLNVVPISNISQNISICNGQSYSINGNTYTAQGVYVDSMTGALGCDSIVTTNLKVDAFIVVNQNFDICQGGQVMVNGNTYTASGVYNDTIQSIIACDTLLRTFLKVIPHTSFNQKIEICEGDTINVNGHIYNSTGIYYDSLQNAGGCDSLIRTDLKVKKHSGLTQKFRVCKGGSVKVNDKIYDKQGIYQDIIMNAAGCDSVLVIDLEVDNSTGGGNFIANVFTPNGDGKNDCFGVTYWKDIKEIEFMIYNRWGEPVFTTKQAWDCWDGNLKGEESEQGTYFYYIKAKTSCGESVYKGDVILIR